MNKKTLLVIAPGRKATSDAVFNILVAETGEVLASHLCSHYCFAIGDLYENRPERKKEWKERFGEIEVKFIDDADITQDELLKRNEARYKALEKEKDLKDG